eukprot:TRINITY_DN78448_c0_g1_i1.p1 TRINITY_DN78448_c0_g1~~TRINITY_DN78448_c0_g1_i1.p1  ORF type:complete len:321 (+),score=32.82 TRINITY_DN78448_c0_g1_i1:145-1107(+)
MVASTSAFGKIIGLVLSQAYLRPVTVASVRASSVTLRALTDENANIPITAVDPIGILKPAAEYGTLVYWIDVGLPWLAIIFLLQAAWDTWRNVGIWWGFVSPSVLAYLCWPAVSYAPGFAPEKQTQQVAFKGGPTGLTMFRGTVIRVAQRSEAENLGVKANWKLKVDTSGNHIVVAGPWEEWSLDLPTTMTFELPPTHEELFKKAKHCWPVVGLEFLTGFTFPPEACGTVMGLGHCIVLVLCYRIVFGSDVVLRMLARYSLSVAAAVFQACMRLRAWQKINVRSISSYLGRKAGTERDHSVKLWWQTPSPWETLVESKMQ